MSHDPKADTTRLLLEAAAKVFDVPVLDDHNTSHGMHGIGTVQRTLGHNVNQPERSTTYLTYVKPYLASRPNLTVVDFSTVLRIEFEQPTATESTASLKRAKSVHFLQSGEYRVVTVGKELIVVRWCA